MEVIATRTCAKDQWRDIVRRISGETAKVGIFYFSGKYAVEGACWLEKGWREKWNSEDIYSEDISLKELFECLKELRNRVVIFWEFYFKVRVIYSSSCYSIRSPEFLFHIYIIYLLRVKLSDLLRFLEIFEIFVGNTGEFLFVIKFILIYFHSRGTFTTVSKSGTQNLKRNF